jgi:hypothetical protein
MSRHVTLAFGVANLITALLVAGGVFVGLPARWAPLDGVAGVVALLEMASGVGLVTRAPWGSGAARAASTVALAAGLFAVTSLAVAASWLSGVYGPVGTGGSIILALVAALVLPYLVVLPCAELVWLGVPRGLARRDER